MRENKSSGDGLVGTLGPVHPPHRLSAPGTDESTPVSAPLGPCVCAIFSKEITGQTTTVGRNTEYPAKEHEGRRRPTEERNTLRGGGAKSSSKLHHPKALTKAASEDVIIALFLTAHITWMVNKGLNHYRGDSGTLCRALRQVHIC